MKRKAILVFTLVFWLLGACTFLSVKAEQEMIPQVVSVQAQQEMGMSGAVLPGDCLIEDGNGPHLYRICQGTGWEEGTRAAEERGWVPLEDRLILDSAWGDFVHYSSKPLREGELIEVVRGREKAPDRWLAVFPEGLAPELDWDRRELPGGVSAEEWNGHAVQLLVEEGEEPFMAGRAKSLVPELRGASVYSFNDMYKLLDSFTALGLLLGILMAALVLWGASWGFSRRARRSRWVLCLNLALGLVLLLCVPLVLDSMDLPSSLLPRERITDFGAMAREMDEFFGALRGFAPPASDTGPLAAALPRSEAGQAIIMTRNNVLARPWLYAFLGAACGGLAALIEKVVLWQVNRPRLRHEKARR